LHEDHVCEFLEIGSQRGDIRIVARGGFESVGKALQEASGTAVVIECCDAERARERNGVFVVVATIARATVQGAGLVAEGVVLWLHFEHFGRGAVGLAAIHERPDRTRPRSTPVRLNSCCVCGSRMLR
jgi:hypothetical protein